jgi:hypothetical protein
MTETDDGPRWEEFIRRVSVYKRLRFLGRAGPLDIWLDPGDPAVPFLVVRSLRYGNWSSDAEWAIQRAKNDRVHLTLHDECMIHTLCAPHNATKQPNPNGD